MITGVPVPSWRQLAALAGRAPDPAALAAPWCRAGEQAIWFSRSSWSLHALAVAWMARHGRAPKVWVPDYFCNGSLDPLRRSGVELTFYPVIEALEADWGACRVLAVSGPPDLFLLPHYFGRPSAAAPARAFCDEVGALLIEDAAHGLRPTPAMGGHGDFVLWSPHKLLPVPQGGLLVCRHPDRLAIDVPGGAAPSIAPWLLKRLVQKVVPGRLLPTPGRSAPQRFADDPQAATQPETPRMAPGASILLAAALQSLAEVERRRRDIALGLLPVLEQRSGWRCVVDPAVDTPYRLVMRCQSPALAAQRFSEYRAAGVPVEAWPDLADEVLSQPEKHADALLLRRTILCFPVHQGVVLGELVRRCRAAVAPR
jgi:hypothetical protein